MEGKGFSDLSPALSNACTRTWVWECGSSHFRDETLSCIPFSFEEKHALDLKTGMNLFSSPRSL